MGAWIEIAKLLMLAPLRVAPLVGAWIEMANKGTIDWDNVVAPLVGAWIEIIYPDGINYIPDGRSSRGSVD